MKNYEFQHGKVKETKCQIKRHYTQLTEQEIKCIKSKLAIININNIDISRHASNHINISIKDIRRTFTNYNIVEFNVTYVKGIPNCRVLIRGKDTLDVIVNNKVVKSNICVVYDFYKKRVCTIYMNDKRDSHDSVDFGRYTDNFTMDIKKLLTKV